MDATFNYGKSNVPASPKFKEIMKKYDVIGRQLKVSQFYNDYVKELDSEISERQWRYFINRFDEHVKKKIEAQNNRILKISEKTAIKEDELEGNAVKKILQIVDFSLDEMLANPELLNKIPIETRMVWLFGAMKARDSRATVKIKQKSEERKTNIYEDMMQGAQYGAFEAEDINDLQAPPEKTPQLEAGQPGIKIPIEKKVEFSPDDLE